MLQNFVKILGGNPNKREVEKLSTVVDEINALEPKFEGLSDEELRAHSETLRARIASETEGIEDEKERAEILRAVLDEILPEAFAAVREAGKRTIGLRHYDVQLLGGAALHRGMIAEMRTGEGKTLVATLPLYLNALTGRGVHLVTVNDYLARRDARWMGAVFHALGLSVGVLQMAASTENGKKAFVYDPEHESSQEDKDKMRLVDRAEAYAADITYGTNSEFGFDYLRDNMTMRLDDRVQRGHYYAIVDEVDNVLVDEARTPLIISGPASGDLDWYGKMAVIVRQIKLEDYELNEKDRTVALTDIGIAHVEQLLGETLRDPDRPEDVTPEQARLLGHLEQALRAQFLFKRNKDYLVQAGKVVIVDEFTGRLMPGRRWSDGLHQAVEAKEGVKVEPENITYATITLQNYFRMYGKLAGMTGTALTEAEEFHKIYKLEVLPIPTNLEYQAMRPDSPLVEIEARDEQGYKYTYYAHRNAASGSGRGEKPEPIFWRRKDYPDSIYRTVEAKLRAIAQELVRDNVMGRPLLVGTTSVESSERLSGRLRAEPVRRLLQVQLVRHAWFEKNGREEDGRLYPELEPLNEPLEKIEPAFLRQFAKPLEVSINPDEPANLAVLLKILELDGSCEPRLKAALQGGVPHQVLNARRHTEESQIIAGAGAFGAVTIATNMAGRGVDIKLGGDLAEEVVASVNRVLRKTGIADPYDMTAQERRAALQAVAPSDYGIYETEVAYFLKYYDDMERVRELGGLHVIGSERHEARRIDNQLRGRAARQGDPGSSRFYLSLEDDLMRLFGGEQIGNLMQRLRVDDAIPLESRMVGNMIESSQHRVEGANFDVRKHLLEYDDVLNAQRQRIYEQRDRVFSKEDLNEDVVELLRAEIEKRVPEALADVEGPWKLLAWLEQIQQPFNHPGGVFPSFTYTLLMDELADSSESPRAALLGLVRRAVEMENEHIQRAVEGLIERTGKSLEDQLRERLDAVDTFLEARRDAEETETRRSQELVDELNGAVRLPLRLTSEQARTLANDPSELEDALKEQVEQIMTNVTVSRVGGAIESRLGEPLEIDKEALMRLDWDGAAQSLEQALGAALAKRLERLVGAEGLIARDLDALLARESASAPDRSAMVRLLATLAQGRRTAFDAKTHRQVQQVYIRFHYTYLAAGLLADRDPEGVTADVLDHLEEAREALSRTWGQSEFARLSQNPVRVAELGPAAAAAIAPDRSEALLTDLTDDERLALTAAIGRRVQTEIYRQVLLGAITELWVEYLTRVEALRVSIGLEAYAQRDPLVQYKGRASEMFMELLGEIRAAVISRIFAYQPRPATEMTLETPEEAAALPGAGGSDGALPSGPDGSAVQPGKRKRHRH